MPYRRTTKSPHLREAAKTTLERIRRDRRRASGREATLLAFIGEHLFDSDLNARLDKRVRALPGSVLQGFYRLVGKSPTVYVRDARLDVGELLLQNTDMMVWEVADDLGYESAKTFSAHFTRHKRKTPSATSKEPPVDHEEPEEHVLAAPAPSESADAESMEGPVNALAGELGPQSAVAWIQRLRTLYPAASRRAPPPPPVKLSRPGYRHERWLAKVVWRAVREMPVDRLRVVMRSQVRFRSAALFRLLGEMGREIGRQDRERGVAITELAVECLEASAEAFGEEVHDLLTVGWSWVANQRRLALDFPGGEEAFGFARQEWETPRKTRDPLAEAEYCNLLGSFRFYQGRSREALRLADRALQLVRSLDDQDLLVRVLSLRAEISQTSANPNDSIPYLREALQLVEKRDNPYLMLTLSSQLIMADILAGEPKSALKTLSRMKALFGSFLPDLGRCQYLWLEGRINQEQGHYELAEQHFQESRSGLAELGEMGYFAFVTLTLAEFYVKQNRPRAALRMISEVIPILETFRVHRGVLASIRLLRGAEREERVSIEILGEVKKYLKFLILPSPE